MAAPTERQPLLADSRRDSGYGTECPSEPEREHGVVQDAPQLLAQPNPSQSEEDEGKPRSFRETLEILGALWLGTFLVAFDGTLVATLLADISSSFHASQNAGHIGTAYLLSNAAFAPLYGKLSDIIGRKAAVLLALSVFGIGTAGCGFAPSMWTLIAARAVAGLGGGGITTVSSIVTTDLVSLKDRGIYQGIGNIVFGLGMSLGAPMGGFCAQYVGWRAAFIIQLPIVLLGLLTISLKLTVPAKHRAQSARDVLRRIDFLGSGLLVLTISALLLGLTLKTSSDLPFSHPRVYGLLAASGALAATFVLVEVKVAREPAFPISLLGERNPSLSFVSNFTMSVFDFARLYQAPLFLRTVKLASSGHTGALLLPSSLGGAAGSVYTGWVMRRTGRFYRLNVVIALFPLVAQILAATWSECTSEWLFVVTMTVSSFGSGGVLTTFLIALVSSVKSDQMAVAIGGSYAFRTLGQVLGVAVSSSILQSLLTNNLHKRITGPGSEDLIRRIREQADILPSLPRETQRAAVQAYEKSFHAVFLVNMVFAVVMFLSALPVKEYELEGKREQKDVVEEVGGEEREDGRERTDA